MNNLKTLGSIKQLSFDQHKYLGQYIKLMYREAQIITLASSWAFSNLGVYRLADKSERALSGVKCDLDNMVCRESPPDSVLYKNGYNEELNPTRCYYGLYPLAPQYAFYLKNFYKGFRSEYLNPETGEFLNKYPFETRSRKRDIGFLESEYLHVTRTLRRHRRRSAMTMTLLRSVYGKCKTTSLIGKWTDNLDKFYSEVQIKCGKIDISTSENYTENVQDFDFALPFISQSEANLTDWLTVKA